MKKKDTRNVKVLKMREKGKTLQEIGDYFNITRERVRQIIAKEEKPSSGVISP